MMATVSSIFMNSQIIVANRWFSDKERATAMSILNVTQPVGQVASFVLTGFAFSNVDENQSQAEINDEVRKSTQTLILYQNIPYVIFFIVF